VIGHLRAFAPQPPGFQDCVSRTVLHYRPSQQHYRRMSQLSINVRFLRAFGTSRASVVPCLHALLDDRACHHSHTTLEQRNIIYEAAKRRPPEVICPRALSARTLARGWFATVAVCGSTLHAQQPAAGSAQGCNQERRQKTVRCTWCTVFKAGDEGMCTPAKHSRCICHWFHVRMG